MNSDLAQRWCPPAIYRRPEPNPACSRRGAMARREEDVLGRALACGSRICGPNASRALIELDRPGGRKFFAVEDEDHDLPLDHTLDQKRAVSVTAIDPLT